MSLGFATALRTARAQAIIDALDAGVGANAVVELYTIGSGQPVTGGAITDQVLVGTVGLSNPSGTVTNGVLTFSAFTEDSSADADATIAWARFYDTDGNFVMDADCGLDGSGAIIEFNSLVAKIGGVINILSGSLTEGNL